MIVEGIELDINPFTLKEWSGLSSDIQQGIKDLFLKPQEFSHVIPVGYSRDPESHSRGIPVIKELHTIISCMDRVRFQETLSITDAVNVLMSNGIKLRSIQSVQNTFDRCESILGISPELPATVAAKAKDTRQKLEWRRKRRVATREKLRQKELRARKKEVEGQLKSQTKKLIKDAKSSKMSLKELQGDAISDTVTKLKSQAKESRFVADDAVEPSRILFQPTPKQAEFLAAPEKVVFYGGAAGGGKSYALIFDAIRYAHRSAMRALILRRRNSELKELISVSKQNYPKAFPGAKFNESKMIWTFPSGATLEFGYFEKEDDKERYIGLPYSYIAWDEIQLQKSPEGFDFLFSRLRTTDPEITCYVRCTGNPGGAPWVKQRFIDPAPYNTPFSRYNGDDKDSGVSYKFIPATLFDNPHLTQDGEYEKILKQMPPKKVQQLLYGDWDTVDDGFFSFDKSLHITNELPPMHWPILNSLDYGWVDPASALWAKVNPENGALHVYREHEMVHATVEQWAQAMKQQEEQEHFVRVQDRVIDHSLFKMTGHTGPSHLETLSKWGFTTRPADRQREPGWEQVNYRLLPNISGQPTLVIHESCKRLIDQLVSAQSRATNPNDIDETRMFSLGRKHHWDLLDCLRYMCMARPRRTPTDSLLQASKSNAAWDKYNNYFS